MRILITPFAWPSHVFPIVPLGWALQLAGHEVRVAALPVTLDAVVSAGLNAVAVGPDQAPGAITTRAGLAPAPGTQHEDAVAGEQWPPDWPDHPERFSSTQRDYFVAMGERLAAISAAMLPDVLRVGEAWQPDLVVHDGDNFAGAVAAAALDVPSARYLVGIPGMMRIDTAYGAGEVSGVRALHDGVGVAVRGEPSAWIDCCPPSVQLPHRTTSPVHTMRYVPYNGRGVLPLDLVPPPRRPRVCITWGGSFERQGPGMLAEVRASLAAIAALGVEVLAVMSDAMRAHLGEVADGVRAVSSVPLGMVLPTCAAIVHHGGAGTTLTAAAHGVPQVITASPPHFSLLAQRVAATGAASTTTTSAAASAATIPLEVERVLTDPAFRSGAEVLAEDIAAQASPADVARALEGLVR